MKNIKTFKARYDRQKRGIDLPRYEDGVKTVIADDGSRFNVYPSVIGASNLTVTTPEIQVTAQMPYHLKKREEVLSDLWHNPGEIRQGEAPTKLDKFRTFLSNYRNNPIVGNVEQAVEDWQHNRTPMQVAFNNFAWLNPYTAAAAGGINLLSDNGIKKTFNFIKNGQYKRAALSGLGDTFNVLMLSPMLSKLKNNGVFDKSINYIKNTIINRVLNKNINNLDSTVGRFKYNGEVLPYKSIKLPQKQANGRYQFDSPTYQMYTGPQHDVSEIINTDGSINLKNLLRIQNEALANIPGGIIARHRLENAKWHPTDWNTFLHTRDVYKRALENNYPKEALFPTLMHDFGKMWVGDGHGPYGASIIRQIFPKASNEQIKAIYEHMDDNPQQYLSRLVKGVDIKELNKFRTEFLLKNLNPKLSENFNANLTSDGIKLFPIKGSDYDLYKTSLYNKLNIGENQRGIVIAQQKNLGRDVDGDYDPITHLSRISEEAEHPLSVAVHEDISHGSDAFVENEPISKFIPKDLIKRDESVSEYYSDLANITGKSKFREHTDEDWKEMRATLQQLRFASKLPVDNISNSSIESALNHVNGYGQDYISKLSWLNDLQKKRWFDKLRIAWKYLPIATPLIKMKNEK